VRNVFGAVKVQSSKQLRVSALLSLAILVAGLRASGQTASALDIHLYAGLSITGQVGVVYSVEYVTDLSQTNSWRSLEFLQLPVSPYLWTDKSAPATGRRFYRARVFETPTNMVFIPPGTFRMSSPSNEVDRYSWEGPQTEVIISRGFWMGKYEVTQGEYLAVMSNNPSYFTFTGDTNLPVERVSWFDATNFCAALTERDLVAGRIPANSAYRLPTEAEWEYACRAQTSTRFSYGDDPDYTQLANYGWFQFDSDMKTHPPGQKLPNPWGLYDMHGNVYEWCQDWWADNLPGGRVIDPQGPAMGRTRVICGGSWISYERACRSAFRFSGDPALYDSSAGFRIVLAPVQP
jgi:formylglycine-generating enzyme required for sulfatase activity